MRDISFHSVFVYILLKAIRKSFEYVDGSLVLGIKNITKIAVSLIVPKYFALHVKRLILYIDVTLIYQQLTMSFRKSIRLICLQSFQPLTDGIQHSVLLFDNTFTSISIASITTTSHSILKRKIYSNLKVNESR